MSAGVSMDPSVVEFNKEMAEQEADRVAMLAEIRTRHERLTSGDNSDPELNTVDLVQCVGDVGWLLELCEAHSGFRDLLLRCIKHLNRREEELRAQLGERQTP